jgi:hypothetical protein
VNLFRLKDSNYTNQTLNGRGLFAPIRDPISKMKTSHTKAVTASALAALMLSLFSPAASAATQDAWRQCRKCNVMFYDGFSDKGSCAAVDGHGGHVAQGFNFILPYNAQETKQAQAAWRYCNKCHAMFYDGYPNKGRCASGGGHRAQGFNFALPHDVPRRGMHQGNWRYCDKCHAMFYDGGPNKGRCAGGYGGHVAVGFNFVLRYSGNQEKDVELNPVNE